MIDLPISFDFYLWIKIIRKSLVWKAGKYKYASFSSRAFKKIFAAKPRQYRKNSEEVVPISVGDIKYFW